MNPSALDPAAVPSVAAIAMDVLTVLVVEDSPTDRRLIVEALVDAGVARDGVRAVPTLREARHALVERPVSCVLLDLSLPDASGLEGVALLAAAAPETPVVVVTGRPGGTLVYAAMAEGADEYLCKSELGSRQLADVLARAIQRRRGADRHRQALSSAASVLDSISSPIAVIDGSGRIVSVNGTWERVAVEAGADPTRTGVGVNYLAVCDRAAGPFAEPAGAIASGIRAVLAGDVPSFTMDYELPTPSGSRWFSLRVSPSGEVGGGAVLIHLDVTELKLAEEGAALAQGRLFGALDAASPIFVLIGADGSVIHISALTRSQLRLEDGERIGASAFDHVEPVDREPAAELLARVSAIPGSREQMAVRVLDGDGRWRLLDLTATNLLHDPRVGAIAITGSDVTDSRLHQIARQLESRILAGLPVAVGLTDARGILAYWNDRAEDLFRLRRADAVGRNVADLGLQTPDTALQAAIDLALQTGGRWEGDVLGRRADGTTVPLHVLIERVDDDEIDFHGYVYASFDNTERHRLESELEFQAFHDPLTSLPNRRLFLERLDALLADQRDDGVAAVTFIDLDDFKALNDRVGHGAGDHALRVIAARLRAALRPGDLVARIGGDEFVVGFAGLQDPAEAVAVAERLLDSLRSPFRLVHHAVTLSATVGIAMSQPGVPADTLLRNADAAMYEAKAAGKDRVGLFDDELQQRARRRREMADRLEGALRAGDVHAELQPQTCLRTGRLIGFEALARWDRPDEAGSDTADFIGLAEECGLIGEIDRVVLREACEALARLHALRPDDTPTMSVNVSAEHLLEPGFPALVRDLVEASGVPPHRLCIEVVESALADESAAADTLEELHRLGVELAIDDFGTGYSSLSRLQRFHVDYLKIDRGFVAGMGAGHGDAAVVSAVIGLAHALGLRTIAEGVETEAQRDRLGELGVDVGQGFLWGPAVPVEEALELVRCTGTGRGAAHWQRT